MYRLISQLKLSQSKPRYPYIQLSITSTTKNGEIEAHFLFQKQAFLLKNGKIEAHFLFETGAFSTKISEIEAHVLFQKWAFSTEIS